MLKEPVKIHQTNFQVKLPFKSGYVQNGGEYILYVRLGAGSENIPVVDVSYQLIVPKMQQDMNQAALAAAMVQLQSTADFAGGEAEMLVADPYKIMIDPVFVCDAASVAADGKVALALSCMLKVVEQHTKC